MEIKQSEYEKFIDEVADLILKLISENNKLHEQLSESIVHTQRIIPSNNNDISFGGRPFRYAEAGILVAKQIADLQKLKIKDTLQNRLRQYAMIGDKK